MKKPLIKCEDITEVGRRSALQVFHYAHSARHALHVLHVLQVHITQAGPPALTLGECFEQSIAGGSGMGA